MKKQIAHKLMNIKKHVSANDRKEARTSLDIASSTVHNYLSGKVSDIDLGIELLDFFRTKIAEKKRLI